MMKYICFALLSLQFFGCSSAYYGMMEKFGVHKRDLLVSRVESARDSQQDAQQQFKSALERFREVTNFDGGDLEDKYEELQSQLDASEKKAKDVHTRIEAVDGVANALFDEWEDELDDYSSDSLRRSSEQELDQTKTRYAQLIKAMRRAESKIDPVLKPLRDQVLYLKHNLNARAIGSLDQELASVEGNVDSLILELQRAVEEADRFIREVGK